MLDFSAPYRPRDRARLDRREPVVRGSARIRSGHLLMGLLEDERAGPRAVRPVRAVPQARRPRPWSRDFAAIVAGSPEGRGAARSRRRSGARGLPARLAPAPMGKAEALQRFTQRSDRAGPRRQDRPGHRPRRRDPAGDRHPAAATAEQPDAGRRGRRRQDGRGRGLRAAARCRATCRRRCKDVSLATLDVGLLAGGGLDEGRVRAAAEGR